MSNSVSMEQVPTLPAQKHPNKFGLKAFGFDYFHFENPKLLEQKHQVKLLETEGIPINFKVNVGISLIDKERLIQYQVVIKIETPAKNEGNLLLVDSLVSYDYWVEDYDHYKSSERKNNFPKTFLQLLGNISISTSRGLLASKLSNTYLQSLVMPLLFQSADFKDI